MHTIEIILQIGYYSYLQEVGMNLVAFILAIELAKHLSLVAASVQMVLNENKKGEKCGI